MAWSRDEIKARILADHGAWRALLARVEPGWMDEPGPMGEWSFKDLVSHLLAWRNRMVDRVEAAAAGRPRPANPWPAGMNEDDPINAWFRDRDAPRSAAELVAAYDGSFDRLAGALESLPTSTSFADGGTAGYFRWTDANGEIESDFFGHLGDHVADVDSWLARR